MAVEVGVTVAPGVAEAVGVADLVGVVVAEGVVVGVGVTVGDGIRVADIDWIKGNPRPVPGITPAGMQDEAKNAIAITNKTDILINCLL